MLHRRFPPGPVRADGGVMLTNAAAVALLPGAE
jgi:hypothetical protein